MKLITKKFSYCNADYGIEKLFAILWEIVDNECIKYQFKSKSDIDKIVR